MTSKTPGESVKQHKTGYINRKGHKPSAYIVQKYGAYLRPSLYDQINVKPMTKAQPLIMEKNWRWICDDNAMPFCFIKTSWFSACLSICAV
jgi:hypothetical protein